MWTADTPTPASRGLGKEPGSHRRAQSGRSCRATSGAHGALDVSAVNYTREYLLAFEQELARAANGDALRHEQALS
jgi:hypothetical protein